MVHKVKSIITSKFWDLSNSPDHDFTVPSPLRGRSPWPICDLTWNTQQQVRVDTLLQPRSAQRLKITLPWISGSIIKCCKERHFQWNLAVDCYAQPECCMTHLGGVIYQNVGLITSTHFLGGCVAGRLAQAKAFVNLGQQTVPEKWSCETHPLEQT